MNKDEVLKLSKLARIEISDAEAEKLTHEFDAILGYVGEIKGIQAESLKLKADSLHNVMREDGEGHESGKFTEEILANAPGRQDNFIKVKKILG